MDLGEPMIFAASKAPAVCGSEQDYGGNSDAPAMEHYRQPHAVQNLTLPVRALDGRLAART